MAYSNPLAAYLAGEATQAQMATVEKWASASLDNQALLESLARSWDEQSIDLEKIPFPDFPEEEEEILEED